MIKKTLILAAVVLLSSCCSPTPNFYQPVAVKTTEIEYPKFKEIILVQQVLLPAENARLQITTTGKEDFELRIDEFNRWGAAPEKLIQRVISQNLRMYFPRASIELQSPLRKNYTYAVAVEITEMNGRLDKNAVLSASYFIKNKTGKAVKSGRLEEEIAIEGGYDAYIPAQSRLLGALSAQIAADLARL